MTFDINDLKALALGIVGGLIVWIIQIWWSNRSIKSLHRRIERAELRKKMYTDIGETDRSLLFMGVVMILTLFGFVSLGFAIHVLHSWFLPHEKLVAMLFQAVMGLAGAALALRFMFAMYAAENYPTTVERLDKKIARLKEKITLRSQQKSPSA
jgi:hypothetical protein